MAKKKILALPAQAGKDIKAVTGIFDRWAVGAEEVVKDVFGWAKKHKFLVVAVIGLIAIKRYWLDDDDEESEDEDYS